MKFQVPNRFRTRVVQVRFQVPSPIGGTGKQNLVLERNLAPQKEAPELLQSPRGRRLVPLPENLSVLTAKRYFSAELVSLLERVSAPARSTDRGTGAMATARFQAENEHTSIASSAGAVIANVDGVSTPNGSELAERDTPCRRVIRISNPHSSSTFAERFALSSSASLSFAAATPSFAPNRSTHATTQTTSANVGRRVGTGRGLATQGEADRAALRPVRGTLHGAHAARPGDVACLQESVPSVLARRRVEARQVAVTAPALAPAPLTRAREASCLPNTSLPVLTAKTPPSATWWRHGPQVNPPSIDKPKEVATSRGSRSRVPYFTREGLGAGTVGGREAVSSLDVHPSNHQERRV